MRTHQRKRDTIQHIYCTLLLFHYQVMVGSNKYQLLLYFHYLQFTTESLGTDIFFFKYCKQFFFLHSPYIQNFKQTYSKSILLNQTYSSLPISCIPVGNGVQQMSEQRQHPVYESKYRRKKTILYSYLVSYKEILN